MLSVYVYSLVIIVFSTVKANSQNIFVQNLQNHLNHLNNSLQNTDISSECLSQLNLYYSALLNQELWALKMFDAHSKLQSGILLGNLYELGNYDECLSVNTEQINGKYCLGTIDIPLSSKNALTKIGEDEHLVLQKSETSNISLYTAVCMPNKCTLNDASKIYILHSFDEKYCQSKDTKLALTTEAIVTIAILATFLLIVVLSTSYDIYLYYNNYKPGNSITVAFSYFTNGKKLITSNANLDQLLCLNGLKAISMMWIVMAHEYVNGSSGAITNSSKILEFIQETASMFIIQASVAVDTFFVIGGLVIVYTFQKAVDKGVKFNLLTFYIHRYIRLTPALAIVVLIHATLLKYFGDGPLWNGFDDHLVTPCRKHYWAALLYIQNYVHDEQACVPQSWYLSIDMQLYVLSPFILLPLKYKPKLALFGLVGLSLAGVVVPFLVAYFFELRAFLYGNKVHVQRHMFLYYEQTYGRFGAYVIGMILGYFIYRIKTGAVKLSLKPMWTIILWCTCIAVGLACVYAGHDTLISPYNKWAHSLYIAFIRPVWALAISGIILLCVTGYGGPINAFLSASIFQFLSKISFALYLTHYELILMRAYSYKTPIIIEEFYVFFNFWGDFIFSVILAILLCLTFESPIITIEKLIFAKRPRDHTRKTASNTQ